MKISLNIKKPRIELIPLLDMIFLVLVSFVYTFLSMTIQKGIPVRLPFAQSAIEDKKEYLIVTITEENIIYINKNRVVSQDLITELKKYKNINPEIKVFLNADKNVIYDKVIEILDSIRQSGIEKVSLETSIYNEQ
ncbi:MAG: biopolymer transporter ExbD [Candidatus Omnitrophota bacterium]|nr:MAG: biopolymer transporter ExbD [Candidatus Omnitrophota bacterium]